ncbi:hypothetical protein OQ273_20985 [Hoeflea prorocentri]|uniref:Uncharacterized protein n=1 Tax=Hoeflea prorocentri TaxID=1922333 RepID=A0A9X3ZJN1_9HYPH|nr:hypothetical protein [Hoeflea prorocentri]MDA5401063.1 hypothetical protein [Hoeflea prorocentri]
MLTVNSAALHILRHDQLPSASAVDRDAKGPDLIATANNVKNASNGAQAKTVDDVFSVHHVDHNQLKMRLFERLGAEFGIKMSEYDSMSDYGEAIRKAIVEMTREPLGYIMLQEIEKKLGLDELGITIDTLVKAIIDPESSHNDKVDEALKRREGGELAEGQNKDSRVILDSIRIDETGTYGY